MIIWSYKYIFFYVKLDFDYFTMMSSSDSQFPFDITMKTAYVDDSEGVSQMVTKIDFFPKKSNSLYLFWGCGQHLRDGT